jgi:hypothetical protein
LKKKRRYPRREIAPGYQLNTAGALFHNKRRVEWIGLKVAVSGYDGPLQPTYETVVAASVDWRAFGLTDEDLKLGLTDIWDIAGTRNLRRRGMLLRRYTDGEVDWTSDPRGHAPYLRAYPTTRELTDYSRPYYLVDELVLVTFGAPPELSDADIALLPSWFTRYTKDADGKIVNTVSSIKAASSLPLFLYTVEHLDGDPHNCHIENLRWTLSEEALHVHHLRRHSIEERKSAFTNPRQGHCRAS